MAEVLPQDKELKVRQLQEAGHKVIMVGDGLNDAPALTRADVGMAIGAGTDVAIESADIVLMKSDLRDVPTAIRLSRAVLRNIKQNLFWAFFYNTLGIPLAAGAFYALLDWQLNPMFAAAAMSMSSVCVVSNALRLRLFKAKHADEPAPQSPCEPQPIEAESTIEKGANPTMEKKLMIEGMMCKMCKAHVEKALAAVAGVESYVVDLEGKCATVAGTADAAALKAAVEEAGYQVISVD